MMKLDKTLKCKDSNKSVNFWQGAENSKITATAYQDNRYWFHIGDYKTLKMAITKATKKLAEHGYELEQERK